MAWWDTARVLLQLAPAKPPAEPFTIACVCGEPMTGMRAEAAQRLTCRVCGETVLVFPASPLPPVPMGGQASAPAPTPTAAPPVSSAPAATAAEPSTAGTPAETSEAAGADRDSRRRQRPARKAADPSKPPVKRAVRQRPELDPTVLEGDLDLTGLAEPAPAAGYPDDDLVFHVPPPPRRSLLRPMAVVAAVLALVSATVWWQARRAYFAQLRDEMVPSGRRGLKALDSGDLAGAHTDLRLAVQAMDTLREEPREAASFRQAFAELRALDDLLEVPLYVALSGGVETANAAIRGRSVILETEVEDLGAGIAFRLLPLKGVPDQPEPVPLARVPIPALARLRLTKPTRMVLALWLREIRLDNDQRPVLEVDSDRVTMITRIPILEALGLGGDPRVSVVGRWQEGLRRWLEANDPSLGPAPPPPDWQALEAELQAQVTAAAVDRGRGIRIGDPAAIVTQTQGFPDQRHRTVTFDRDRQTYISTLYWTYSAIQGDAFHVVIDEVKGQPARVVMPPQKLVTR